MLIEVLITHRKLIGGKAVEVQFRPFSPVFSSLQHYEMTGEIGTHSAETEMVS